MAHSRLFLRLFSSVLLVVVLFSSAYYLLSVPLVKDKAYQIELDASRTILDNVYEMVGRIRSGLEEQRASIVDNFKAEMRAKVSLAAGYIDYVLDRQERGEITRAEAERLIYDGLKAFKTGKDDYIWLTSYESVLLSHADPEWIGQSAADVRDQQGRFIVPTMIERARREGEGYHVYPWRRPSTEPGPNPPVQKMSYFRDLKRHGMVIGAGAYMDDMDAVIEHRMSTAIEDLRQALRNIRIARSGYVYIFDSTRRMLIHPNANIEGTAFGDLRDPSTGAFIGEALMRAAHEARYLRYLWDKPSDPNNYAYEKISWVRHEPGLDWYLASSVYEEELRSSSTELGNRLFAVSLVIMGLGGGLGYVGARRLVSPLRRLADTAAQVRAGNLDARSGIVRNDEIGDLAATFDGMVRRVKDDIATLDSRVKERTAALEDAEARQRLILDAIPAAIAYLDGNERLRFVNRRWTELPHTRRGPMLGHRLREAVTGDAYERLSAALKRARTGETSSFDHATTTLGGRVVITRNTVIPQQGSGGAAIGFFVLTLDVTDETERQRHLEEAERLKAVGQLAGGLAHDFNNLLTIILGNLAVARERFADLGELNAYLEPAQRASRRGADITARLLAFSRRQPLKPQQVEVCTLVREMAVLLSRSLPATIALATPGPEETVWAVADPMQLENALVNLALNSRDAMPAGGTLAISVRPCAAPAAEFDEPLTAGRYVEIQLRDTGNGFAPGAAARAFEPFFTTKALGSGLGLSMVYGFVKQSGGYIRIDSAPGRGTAITLLLPEAETPAAEDTPGALPDGALPSAWRGMLALVVEDDDDVRLVLRQQLMDFGLSVIEAASGEEAMELADQIDDLRLVVSDIVMPGISGLTLARHLRATRPDVQVILVSGFSTEDHGEDEGLVILGKPWEKNDLAAAIRLPAEA